MTISLTLSKGEVTEATVHNVKMLFIDAAESIKCDAGKPLGDLHLGDEHQRSVQALFESSVSGKYFHREMEKRLIWALQDVYEGMHFDGDEWELAGEQFRVVSTQRGSLAIVTDCGGIYNLFAKDPTDVFVFKQFLDKFTKNYGLAEEGTKTERFYTKLGYKVCGCVDGHSIMYRVNPHSGAKSTIELTEEFLRQLGLTPWELSYDTTTELPIYSAT